MQEITFDPVNPKAALDELPRRSAVFALYFDEGSANRSASIAPHAEAHSQSDAEPYIGRTPNLQARLARLLQPSEKHPRRLQLAQRVRRIAWRLTGSDFESLLAQFSFLQEVYGAKALERMHLRMPAFARFLGGNPYPRVVVTHRATYRPGQREADWAYGPFPSRSAAERFVDETLKLFLLRRCVDDLHPDPGFPGCVYSEMKMCLAPCFKGCTEERYQQEAAAVRDFLATRGESQLGPLRARREEASANLEFESAAALHAQVRKVEGVRAMAAELVRPVSQLRAVVLQPSAEPGKVSVFLFEDGRWRGPADFSTLGMRIQNEQSGSTSLFAQPVAMEAAPEGKGQGLGTRESGTTDAGMGESAIPPESEKTGREGGAKISRSSSSSGLLETRWEAVLAGLRELAAQPPSAAERQGHLALLKRWYYRPEARREGEIFFPDAEGQWPIKAILRGIGRVAAKAFTAPPHN